MRRFQRTFNPRRSQLHRPTAGVFDPPTGIVAINRDWLSHIIGVLDILALEGAWIEESAIDEIQRLLNSMTDNDLEIESITTELLTVFRTGANANIIVSGDSGRPRQLLYRTGNLNRWAITATNAPEGVGNAGSDLQFIRFNDDGSLLGSALFINRATGNVTVFGSVGFNGSAPSRPVITGPKAGNLALSSLIAGLVSIGLITDSTT